MKKVSLFMHAFIKQPFIAGLPCSGAVGKSSVLQGCGVQEIQGDNRGKAPRAIWHLCASSASKVHAWPVEEEQLCGPLCQDYIGTIEQGQPNRKNSDTTGTHSE